MYQCSRKDPKSLTREIQVCFEKTNYTNALSNYLQFNGMCLAGRLKSIPFYNITAIGQRNPPTNRDESNLLVNRELGLISKYPTIQLYTTPASAVDIELYEMVDHLNQIMRTRDSKLTSQKEQPFTDLDVAGTYWSIQPNYN